MAATIAQAMGALHQLERARQLTPHASQALGHMRAALAQLQSQVTEHVAVENAMEAVATALSLIHGLVHAPPPPEAVPASPQRSPGIAAPAASPPAMVTAPPQDKLATAAAAPVACANAPAVVSPPAATSAPEGREAPVACANAPQPASQTQSPSVALASPSLRGATGNSPISERLPLSVSIRPATPSMPVPAPPSANLPVVSADLGAHSPTNFFKGLSGNDLIEHGGLFVATYVLPPLGSAIRLRVSLPGGYEFQANAIVKWLRDDGGSQAPPGFGAQFTAITPEAKQLVYRYVRNREPLFHDDL